MKRDRPRNQSLRRPRPIEIGGKYEDFIGNGIEFGSQNSPPSITEEGRGRGGLRTSESRERERERKKRGEYYGDRIFISLFD